METLLEQLRGAHRQPTQPETEALLLCVDCLKGMLDAKRSGTPIEEDKRADVVAHVGRLLTKSAPVEETAAQKDSNTTNGAAAWRIRFKPHAAMLQTGNDVVRIFRELMLLGTVRPQICEGDLPAMEDLDPENCYLSWTLDVVSGASREEIEEVFAWVEDEADLDIVAITETMSDPEGPPTGENADAGQKELKSVPT